MTTSSLYRRLWVRMAVASLLGVTGFLVVLLIELLTIGVLLWGFIDGAIEIASSSLVFLALGTILVFSWWLVVTLLKLVVTPGAASDSLADPAVSQVMKQAGPVFWHPLDVIPAKWILIAWAVPLSVIALYTVVIDLLGTSAFVLGLIGGTLITAYHTRKILVEEFQKDSTVASELNDAYLVTDNPDKELLAEIEERVKRLAKQADIQPPTVKIGESYSPQAATVGYRPAESTLIVSRGLIEMLEDEELDAVLAHELGHLLNRDSAVLTALSLPAARAKRVFSFGPLMVIAWVIAGISHLTVPMVARYREYVADRAAAQLTGDPAALASALIKLDDEVQVTPETDARQHRSTAAFGIVPPPWEDRGWFDGPARFFSRTVFGTHPSTEKRIRRLQALTRSI